VPVLNRSTLEEAGVEFLARSHAWPAGGGEGVRLRR